MDFAFNFELTDSDAIQDALDLDQDLTPPKSTSPKKEDVSVSFEVTTFHTKHVLSKLQTKIINLNDCQLRIVDTSALEQLILTDSDFKEEVDTSNMLSTTISHSDLVDGVYEGGLKVWECALDLANFLALDSQISNEIQGRTVLDLGCGAGIPGLYCAMTGAARVDFQDYNDEVLKLLTQPNVENNAVIPDRVDSSTARTECRYFAGDWSSFVELECLQNVSYDVILSAETIYNVANYAKLHKIFDELLATNGLIFVAAKSYYFGVGGSIEAFIEFVTSQRCFCIEVVHTSKKGVLRKILRLKRHSDKASSS